MADINLFNQVNSFNSIIGSLYTIALTTGKIILAQKLFDIGVELTTRKRKLTQNVMQRIESIQDELVSSSIPKPVQVEKIVHNIFHNFGVGDTEKASLLLAVTTPCSLQSIRYDFWTVPDGTGNNNTELMNWVIVIVQNGTNVSTLERGNGILYVPEENIVAFGTHANGRLNADGDIHSGQCGNRGTSAARRNLKRGDEVRLLIGRHTGHTQTVHFWGAVQFFCRFG